MATIINLPLYNIEDNNVYINGKVITDNMILKVKKLTTERYNIDFFIQFGNTVNYNNTTITVEGADHVLTSLPGEFGQDRKLGKHKLLQIVKVGDISSFKIKFTGGVTYTINVQLVSMDNTDVYLPNLKTNNDISFYPNGAAEYPISNFDIPLPITSNIYKIGWSLNNVSTELPLDGLTINIIYNTELYNITNLNNNDVRTKNNLTLELDTDIIDLRNITVPTFTSALVFEFVDTQGVILSTRSITLIRTNLYLVDEFDRVIDKLYLPQNPYPTLNKDHTQTSRLPNTNELVTPYVTWINNNGNNGFINLVKNIVDIQPTNNNSGLTLTKNTQYNGYDLRFVYKTPGNYHTLKLLVKSVLIDSTWQSFITEELSSSPAFDIDNSSLVINKYQKENISFVCKNIAKVEVVKVSGPGNIDTTVTYTEVYNVTLPHNGNKVFPDLSGTISFDCLTSEMGTYVYKLKYLDCENTLLGETSLNIVVKRPAAEIDTDFETNKFTIDVEKVYYIDVECSNVYEATIQDTNNINFTAEILDINHSDDLLESGVYEDYNFRIKITPIKPGIGTFTLSLSDDQHDIHKEYTKMVDVYTVKYTATRPTTTEKDLYQGLNPKFSYSKKYKHNIPLAFVNKGDVADYILVAKYPLPQTDNIGANYSKAFKNRLQLIKENKIKDNTNAEGGELYRIISPDYDTKIVAKLNKNKVLNNKAVPVVNSSFVDHMLANLTDISYYGIIENNKDDIDANHFATFKGLTPNTHKFATYPENPLVLDNTNGGTWNVKNNNRLVARYYGAIDHSISENLDMKNYPLLPVITNDGYLTHNGQSNGIVDPYNMGVKVYHDIKVEYDPAKGFELDIVDPYESTQSNTNDRSYKKIEFNSGQFMMSVNKSYFEPNDYPINIKSRVFSGVEYWKHKDISLMDNAGLPYDNMVIDYEDDDTFKGNKGFRSTLNTYRYGDSIWCNDLDKIEKLNKKASLYYVSGGMYGKSLVRVFDTTNNEPNHIVNRYKEYLNTIDIGYRSRLLLDSNVCYNINKNDGYKNDHLFYNYRVSFLVFDKGVKDKVKLNVSTEWLLLEKNKTYPFVIESDGDVTIENNPNLVIDIGRGTVTTKNISEGSITIRATKTGKAENIRVIEYKIIDTLPVTSLTISTDTIQGFERDTIQFTVTTEDKELIIDSDNPSIYTMSNTSTTSPYTYVVTLLRKGTAKLTFKAKVDGKSENIKHVYINIEAKTNTIYSISPNEVTFSANEVVNSLNTGILMENVDINHNLSSPYELGLWSTDLNNKRFIIDQDMKFNIDMGSPTNGRYVINYVAQVGAIFNQSDVLSSTEPVSSVTNNPNSKIRGTFTIIIK
jgi:hypothetical protein